MIPAAPSRPRQSRAGQSPPAYSCFHPLDVLTAVTAVAKKKGNKGGGGGGRRKEEGGRRKEKGGRRKEEGERRKEEGGRGGREAMAPAALFFSSVLPLSPLSLSLFLPFFACLFVCVCGVLSRTIFLRGAARMRRSRWLSGHRSANRPGDPTPPPTPPTEMGEWREVEGGGGRRRRRRRREPTLESFFLFCVAVFCRRDCRQGSRNGAADG